MQSTAADHVVWETVDCPLCGAQEGETILSSTLKDGALCQLQQCQNCEMVYLNPRPTSETISHYYPEDYVAYVAPRPSRNPLRRLSAWLERIVLSEDFNYPLVKPGWRRTSLARLSAPFVSPDPGSHTCVPYHGEGRLLDVGCGGGWLGCRLEQRGWKVTGLDFSPHAVEMAKKNYGLNALLGTLPHPELEPESFDAVNLGAVLEHVHDPHQLLTSVQEVLRPGGLIFLSVPNFACDEQKQFGEDWDALSFPHHLLHFTPVTLRRLVEAHGLQVQELRINSRASWVRRSYNQVLARDDVKGLKRLWTKVRRLRPFIQLKSWWSARRKQGNCLFLIAQRPMSKTVNKPVRSSAA